MSANFGPYWYVYNNQQAARISDKVKLTNIPQTIDISNAVGRI